MKKKILVALDNSGYATKVMQQALEMAKLYQAELFGVSVFDDSWLVDESSPYAADTLSYLSISYQAILDQCAKLAKEEETNVDYTHKTLKGNPAEEIIKYAEQEGVAVIVMGHLGKSAESGASGFPIGSVALKVATYSKCSVYIVK